jgi:hypothetical protein
LGARRACARKPWLDDPFPDYAAEAS